MKLSQRQQLKQQLTLAPQMIQSLNMLQVPILKLEQILRQELSANPMLEEEINIDETDAELDSSQEEESTDPELDKIDWETYFGEDHEINAPKWRGNNEEGEDYESQIPASEKNLYEHLNDQLSYAQLNDNEKLIGRFIIGNLDEAGFLTCDVDEIAEALSVDELQVWRVLSVIQGFDPPGVGARNLKESLLIQMNNKEMVGTLPYIIVANYFDRLDKLSHSQLARLLKVPQDRIDAAFEDIKQLAPEPAMGRFSAPAVAIVPDLIVERIDDEFVIIYNDKNMPRLKVSNAYRDYLKKDDKKGEETQKYIKEKLNQARWFLSAINQRRSTMLKTMRAIVEAQKEFFEHGESHLKPLRMEDIAEEIEVDTSTVSRVANGKYVQTPMGVFEIKYFFNSGVSTDDGEELSKRNVKQLIAQIISEEDSKRPLPDQKIKKILDEKGIKIARRTVSKYREELKIMPARFRKRADKEKESMKESASNSDDKDKQEVQPAETVW
ncbi:MAG: RNA polymerase factor sigma-54 [candidate division Zixibacteria bacterium]|nr:RNA polymerase factor sigma-54 [candidate division Zixibacteria bacterium]